MGEESGTEAAQAEADRQAKATALITRDDVSRLNAGLEFGLEPSHFLVELERLAPVVAESQE